METNVIYIGDCLKTLRKLPANSVQCCVTSPPYYALRDYQTATWVGGDTNCDHMGEPMRIKANINANCGTGSDIKNKESRQFFKAICAKATIYLFNLKQ